MKLNYRRTLLVGLAFLSISAFWQMYDGVIPKILTGTFGIGETVSGGIMAADNVLALFLLPLFGSLSDKCSTRIGRRMPFIQFGTIGAVLLMLILPLIDNSYAAAPAAWKLIAFIVVLGLLLLTMGVYRSPAVALMPDVTPKPLRSKGNAIINLMGAAGGILYLIVSSVLYSKSRIGNVEHVDYFLLFAIVAGIMAVAVLVLRLTIDEPKLVNEAKVYDEPDEAVEVIGEKQKLSKPVLKSLIFLLLSVFLWFFGYNGITTWFTTFADQAWNMELGDASLCLTIATAGAIVSYIPIGMLSSKIGRKKSILLGAAVLASCFAAAYIYTLYASAFSPLLYIVFVLVGFAWAAISVNSLPMVVEMCHLSDVGRFTGYYYTFSMAAQTITPIAAGALLENVSYKVLFLYSALFVAASFVTMLFVRHGDTVVDSKKSLLENFDVED
ncbi:MAG: MFS transporter [Clostridia bacterium]|nr:MFS transporter [Clostridia bacterium]